MNDASLRRVVEELHARYIRIIDDDRIEEWPDLFTDPCLYRITTRENFEMRLPLAIMECTSRGMLLDRITGLRRINVYEPQRYLHFTSGLAIERLSYGKVKVRSNYLVMRTLGDGSMIPFSAGIYEDRIHIETNNAKFEERIVVQDSRRVETLIVIPL
jgi:anthranilate 1,2-dioxygenase small subunit